MLNDIKFKKDSVFRVLSYIGDSADEEMFLDGGEGDFEFLLEKIREEVDLVYRDRENDADDEDDEEGGGIEEHICGEDIPFALDLSNADFVVEIYHNRGFVNIYSGQRDEEDYELLHEQVSFK